MVELWEFNEKFDERSTFCISDLDNDWDAISDIRSLDIEFEEIDVYDLVQYQDEDVCPLLKCE